MALDPSIPGQKSQFDIAREKVGQRFVAQQQSQEDALKRRAAALGNMNSGALDKQRQISQDQVAQQREGAIADVNSAEMADTQHRQDVQNEQKFQADQANLGRQFTSAEAEKQRGFQGEQSGIDRDFQNKVFTFDSSSKLRALDQADREFGLQQTESEFNRRLAKYQAGHSGGLLGGGGFLGTGIGAGTPDI